MNIEEFRDYCLTKRGVTEEFPFDETTLVFKVMGKMFAASGIEEFNRVNLKCNPELAIELREQFPEVQPGYHMSKKHWNSVYTNGSLSNDQIFEWIDMSYELVVKGLTKKQKLELKEF